MKKMVLGNKKGLSDVVTTVLIILLALVAVAIIGTVVINNVNKSSVRAEVLQACQEIDLKPTKCVSNAGGTTVTLQRGPESNAVPQVVILATDAAGTRPYYVATGIPAAYESSNVVNASAVSKTSVRIAPHVTGSDGNAYPCNPVDVTVQCTAS